MVRNVSDIKIGKYYLCGDQYVVKIVGIGTSGRFEARCWGSHYSSEPKQGKYYTMDSYPDEWIRNYSYCILPIANEEQARMYAHIVGDPFLD